MKTFTSICLILLFSIPAFSQDSPEKKPEFIYCELVGSSGVYGSKMRVVINQGENMSSKNPKVIDPTTGKAREFKTMIDALNYMNTEGWEFVQAYAFFSQGISHQYHYLLRKRLE